MTQKMKWEWIRYRGMTKKRLMEEVNFANEIGKFEPKEKGLPKIGDLICDCGGDLLEHKEYPFYYICECCNREYFDS